MSAEQKRWFSYEIPLWGVLSVIVMPTALWLINLEFRLRSMETDAVAMKASYKNVDQLVWQMKAVQDTLLAMSGDMKTIARLNVDVLLLQRELDAINCRNGGRCEVRK